MRKPFKDSGKDCMEVQCPIDYCEGVPHIKGTVLGGVAASTSGKGLILEYGCEYNHHWQIIFTDHSGSTWIGVKQLPDLKDERWWP
jgi:hypothetical protein